jgi:pimeloyl-ACP methyl ester carboxylesterase
VAVTLVVLAAAAVWAVRPTPDAWTTEDLRLAGDSVELDARFYLPRDRDGKVPAVLLAHGFGGSKESVRSDAESLAERGYAVLAYTARGFGRSTGQIHLDSPDHEVKDAQRHVPGDGRRIRLTGRLQHSEIRISRGGMATLSAMFTREFVEETRRAHRDGDNPALPDPSLPGPSPKDVA